MLEGLQEAVGFHRQGCSLPVPLLQASKRLSTNGEGPYGAHTAGPWYILPNPAACLSSRASAVLYRFMPPDNS